MYSKVLMQDTENLLESMLVQVKNFKAVLGELEAFLTKFCEGQVFDAHSENDPKSWSWSLEDADVYKRALRDLTDNLEDLQLKDIRSMLTEEGEELWGVLSLVKPSANLLFDLKGSAVLSNALALSMQDFISREKDGERLSFSMEILVSEVIPSALSRVQFLLCSIDKRTLGDVRAREIKGLLKGVEAKSLRVEIKSLVSCEKSLENWTPPRKVLEELKYFLKLEESVKFAKAVMLMAQLFKCEDASPEALNETNSLLDFVGEDLYLDRPVKDAISRLKEFEQYFKRALDTAALIFELSKGESLLAFVKDIADERYLNLIDSVEEHGGYSSITMETIYHLDVVLRILRPILKTHNIKVLDLLLQIREGALREHKAIGGLEPTKVMESVAQSVRDCNEHVYGLRDIYDGVANRQDLVKATVAKILECASLYYERDQEGDGGFMLFARFETSNGRVRNMSAAELQDLKERALLHVNTIKLKSVLVEGGSLVGEDDEQHHEQLREFIKLVQVAFEIKEHLHSFYLLGHFDFRERTVEVSIAGRELLLLAETLKNDLEGWRLTLNRVRLQSYPLNFFFSEQLWYLADFFLGAYPECSREIINTADMIMSVVGVQVDKQRLITEWYGRVPAGYEDAKGELHPSSLWPVLASQTTSPERRLEVLGEILEDLFRNCQEYAPCAAPEPKILPTVMAEEPVFMSVCGHEEDVYATTFALYAHIGGGLARHRLLICDHDTTEEEIDIFVRRVYSPGQAVTGLFCVLNLQVLPHERRSFFAQATMKAYNSRRQDSGSCLIIVIPVRWRWCLDGLGYPVYTVNPLPPLEIKAMVHRIRPAVVVISSEQAGIGKTDYVRCDAKERHDMGVHTVALGDGIRRTSIVKKLQNRRRQDGDAYHFDISGGVDLSEMNMAIFELVILGNLHHGTDVINVPADIPCYIEVSNASTRGKGVSEHLHVLEAFPKVHLTWSLDAIKISDDVTSDMQVVCHYLVRMEGGALNREQLFFGETPDLCSVGPLAVNDCLRLLEAYFYRDLHFTPSHNTLRAFLGVLADQLRKFSDSPYFSLEHMDPTHYVVREQIVRNLVNLCRDFATRCVQPSRQRQQHSLNHDDAIPDWVGEGGLVRWEDDNHTLLVFHPADGGVTPIYRHVQSVQKDVKDLFRLYTRSLNDYSSMSDADLRVILCQVCGVRELEDLGPRAYKLTPDNFMKIVMIITRIEACIPIILMGETGEHMFGLA